MRLTIPLDGTKAEFDDGNLYLTVDPSTLGDAIGSQSDANVRELVLESDRIIGTGLEAALSALEESNDAGAIERHFAILNRVKASLREWLEEPRVYDYATHAERLLTSEETARMLAAVGA
jgi:hypothetical protein